MRRKKKAFGVTPSAAIAGRQTDCICYCVTLSLILLKRQEGERDMGKKPILSVAQVAAHWLEHRGHVEKSVIKILKVLETPKGQKVGVLPPTSENRMEVRHKSSGKPFTWIK
jgi:hypothetical protein